jgi:hypothetical protein
MSPVASDQATDLAGTRRECSGMAVARIRNYKIQLATWNAPGQIRIGNRVSEELPRSRFGHEAENGLARQGEFGHARHLERGCQAQHGLVEPRRRILVGNVENDVRAVDHYLPALGAPATSAAGGVSLRAPRERLPFDVLDSE